MFEKIVDLMNQRVANHDQKYRVSSSQTRNKFKKLVSFFSIRVFFHEHLQLTGQQEPSVIPLYHFHSLTNIHTFICNFAYEMTITYF